LEVLVAAITSYSESEHWRVVEQTRLELVVAGVDSYSSEVQVERELHTRSLEIVGDAV
jgi:hypothetical protein